MLVLTRRVDEKIIITTPNETIEVMIADINGRHVKVGVKAPKHIPIHREEIFDKIQEGEGSAA